LAGEYFAWTGDLGLLSQLETNLRAGLHWLTKYGGLADGYLRYERRSARGLVNQGWKDSHDALSHEDGSLCEPPISLAEVQAYACAAYRSLSRVFVSLGDNRLAAKLEQDAAMLARRFNRDFWLPSGFYALALDGGGRRAASITSNAGQVLWGGAASRAHAAKVVRRLMEPDMFSGWGIRTLSATSRRYNPLGYHVGTVWPHDNSLIAMGFKRYGFEQDLNRLATALFDAARAFTYYRLPELFGGDERSVHQAPVPYPIACRPQAWAAGSIPLITQAILGLCPDAPARTISIVRPQLPDWLQSVNVNALRVGNAEVDLRYRRRGAHTRVDVIDIRGDLRVEKRRSWPEQAAVAPELAAV
jgi:glycogen debranching enzyme